jgi:hypothetical protein
VHSYSHFAGGNHIILIASWESLTNSTIIIQWDKFKGTGNFTIPKIYVIGIL